MFKEGDILCSKYELVKQFNKGGFSSVWLAKDLKAKQDFAVKIYAQESGLDEDGIEEFREEYNLVVNLTHSNIFKPLAYDIHDNKPFLVMPYCKKGSASSLIGKITEDEAWDFAHDVAAGLAYLHDTRNIVHQDIKPGNILIDEDGKYMITDFGISTKLHKSVRMTLRQAQEMQNTNYGCGTPEYMGPERWPQKGYVPPAKPIFGSDIWSLGATLYELLAGDVPFGETGGAMQRGTHTIPAISGNYSKELKKLISLCLSEDAWNRPTAKLIAENALLHKAPVLPKPRHKWIKYAITSCFVVGVGSGVCYVWQKDQTPPNPNDSIFMTRVEQAVAIVEEQGENSRKDEYEVAIVCAKRLAEAGSLYIGTDTLKVSHDSLRIKGKELWASSQKIIDEAYQHYAERERYYRNIEADSPANAFASCCNDIKKYVSANIKLNN